MSMTNASDPDDLTVGIARLEAALERIDSLASIASSSQILALQTPLHEGSTHSDPYAVSPVILDRLDSMIARLRAAIDEE